MKRLLRFGVFCALLTAALCVSVFAADVTEAGIYDLNVEGGVTGVTLTAGTGAGANFAAKDAALYKVSESGAKLIQDDVEGSKDFFPGADSVKVEVNTTDTKQYLLIAQSENGVPKEDNIVYIDQTVGEASGAITFYVYPKTLNKGTYYIYLSSTNGERQLVATFEYYIPRMLGDVNGINSITSADSLLVLRHAAGLIELDGIDLWAADVNKVNGITSADSLLILRFAAGLIDSF